MNVLRHQTFMNMHKYVLAEVLQQKRKHKTILFSVYTHFGSERGIFLTF